MRREGRGLGEKKHRRKKVRRGGGGGGVPLSARPLIHTCNINKCSSRTSNVNFMSIKGILSHIYNHLIIKKCFYFYFPN